MKIWGTDLLTLTQWAKVLGLVQLALGVIGAFLAGFSQECVVFVLVAVTGIITLIVGFGFESS